MAVALSDKNKQKNASDDLESNGFEDIDELQGKGKKRKILKTMILGLIFLSFVALLTAILGFNLFNIRDNYLRGVLENIPIVNNVLPPLEASQDDAFAQMSNAELLSTIEYLQAQLNLYEEEINHLNEVNSIQISEIVRLQEIEDNQLQFRADQEAFDRMIAENDPNAFMAFYSSMDPENAQILYSEAVVSSYRSRELRNYVATFEAMDRRRAATTLETMMETELDLVVSIIYNMNIDQRASILNSMEPQNAAIIATMMAPDSLS